MKVALVGGTGNISTSIVRLLLSQGHGVTCYNRGQSGEVPEGARVIHGDRSDRAAFEQAMQAERFDAAIDMICFTAEEAYSSLRAFRDVGHFVQCSTVCTYGVQYDWLPVTEDHPLRPTTDYGRNKVKADAVFMEAYYGHDFPVTIIKPSTTYGPRMGMLRQVAWEFGWIDRVRKGKPILVCGDGNAIHQFLHVDDAALCFAGVLGKTHCLGQTYNMVKRGFISWADYHRTAMKVLGREVELVGVPLQDLLALEVPAVDICRDIFAHNCYYSAEKLFRDAREFQPAISLEEGIRRVIEAMDAEGRVPNSDNETWEDAVIAAQGAVRRGSDA
ncbi:MAG TPA: NAD-dependent epimerase/dehydratase family protein [Abditibacteriaceae bacterium]|nr:NAD-dependent epimerase/dehydratase family protein [Abditibacteriaceae bacterium]